MKYPEENNCDKIKLSQINKIELKNIYYKYINSKKYAVKNVSLCFYCNNHYIVFGENGCGKSTLLKIIAGVYKPTRGDIFINDININDIDLNSYRNEISCFFQNYIKYPFSLIENIILEDTNCENSKLIDIATDLKLYNKVKNLPDGFFTQLGKEWNNGCDFSSGEWQRVALARCLYNNASLKLFDEAFSNIDQKSKKVFLNSILKTHGFNIFVSHELNIINKFDNIIFMKKGKVSVSDNLKKTFKNKNVRNFFNNNLRGVINESKGYIAR